MNKYQEAKIYVIRNNTNANYYVGATIVALEKRFSDHRGKCELGTDSRFYNAMRIIGSANFRIQLVRDFPCANKEELEAEESRIIRKWLKLGLELYNTINDKIYTASPARKLAAEQRRAANKLKLKCECCNQVFGAKNDQTMHYLTKSHKEKAGL
jgi:hypothetical protein